MAAVWLDGYLYPDGDARLSVFDHAVVVGDGVFETLKVVGGEAFAVRRHLDRLRRSADALALETPPEEVVRAAVVDVLRADPGAGRLRITLTAGRGPLGSGRGDAEPSLLVMTGPRSMWPAAERIAVAPWVRNERSPLVGVKSISYGENVQALRWARERGAGEAIFANSRDLLCEGTGTNIFVVRDERIATPSLSSGCLAGITRELLLEVIEVEERDILMAELATADEVFLTSSTRDIQPVGQVDQRAVPLCPGPLTQSAAAAFARLPNDP